eukprot:1596953-Amphidinium_carterae.1
MPGVRMMAGAAVLAVHCMQLLAGGIFGWSPVETESPNSSADQSMNDTHPEGSSEETVFTTRFQLMVMRAWHNFMSFPCWNILPFNRNGLVGHVIHRVSACTFGSTFIAILARA